MGNKKQQLLDELDLILGEDDFDSLEEIENIDELEHYLESEKLSGVPESLEKTERNNEHIVEADIETDTATDNETDIKRDVEAGATNIDTINAGKEDKTEEGKEIKEDNRSLNTAKTDSQQSDVLEVFSLEDDEIELLQVEDRDLSYSDSASTSASGVDELIDLDLEYGMDDETQTDAESDKKKGKKRKKKAELKYSLDSDSKNIFKKYKNYWIYGGCFAILLVVLILIVLVGPGSKESPIQSGKTPGVKKESTQSTAEEDNPLVMNQYPEIKTLVEAYYQAITDCDLDKLKTLVDDASGFTVESLQKQKEYMESYANFETYVKNGLTENTYVVWVYYETKLLNIDTYAPGSSVLYVERNAEDDSVRICNYSNNEKVLTYMTSLMEDQDVVDFNRNVNLKLEQARGKDADLDAFVAKINGEDESSAEGETTAQEEATTQAQSE